MKTLTLLRHAKSDWDDPVQCDFDRPLNRRGRRAARIMGREMRAQGLMFDRVVASPAVRVVETLEGLWEGYGRVLETNYDRRIYLASVSTLAELIRELGESTERVLLVGHNPGLESLALLLTSEENKEGLCKQIEIKYPTGTLAEIALPVSSWREVDGGIGCVSRFIRPRDLDPDLGPDH